MSQARREGASGTRRAQGRDTGEQGAAGEQLVLLHDSSVARSRCAAPEQHRGGGMKPPARLKITEVSDNLAA
ncbi:hypothetical protein RGQ21_09230 [Kitasatospora aureofaciens]|nr:hypothetical protein RGQ21_09230 [Kitasatospora aureofaciens]